MVQGLKDIYIQLGYYLTESGFNDPVDDPLAYGIFVDFDQREFIGIDSTLPD